MQNSEDVNSPKDADVQYDAERCIFLRALEVEDYLKTFSWRNLTAYQNGVASLKRWVSRDTEKRWIEIAIKDHESLKALRFGVVLRATDELLGISMLKKLDLVNRSARSSIFIGENRGRGYGKEALIQTLRYGFCELGLRRVSAGIMEGNVPSIRCYESVGFRREGVSREAVYKSGMFRSLFEYGILRAEYFEHYVSEQGCAPPDTA